MDFRRRAGEVGMDLNDFPVGHHHQQRWVVQGKRVGHELFEGEVQRLCWRLVLPGKTAPLPDVRPTVPSAGVGRSTLETISVWVVGFVHAQEIAEVEEECMSTSPLGQQVVVPLCDEFGWAHGMSALWFSGSDPTGCGCC